MTKKDRADHVIGFNHETGNLPMTSRNLCDKMGYERQERLPCM